VQHTCALVLHCVHSRRRTTFLVVFALCLGVSRPFLHLECVRSYLVEDGLGLTSVTGLLAVITTLTLREQRSLASLVLYTVSVYGWCECVDVHHVRVTLCWVCFLQSLPLQ
jgi:hypothetical protein